MRYVVKTPPSEYPVSLTEAKEHLRLDSVSLGNYLTTQQTIVLAEYVPGTQTGVAVDVLGKRVLVNLNAGTVAGTLDVTVQESADTVTWTDVHDFAQVTPANDNAIYEYEYVGVQRYLRAVGTTATGNATYSVDILTAEPYASDDVLVESLILTATDITERYLRKKLVSQTMELHLDGWPEMPFEFHWKPLQDVNSITCYDRDNLPHTVASTVYFVDEYGGRIGFEKSQRWPSYILRPLDSVVIEFDVGYGGAADVPETIKRAICILIAHLYENREPFISTGAVPKEMPLTYHSLLFPHRDLRFG